MKQDERTQTLWEFLRYAVVGGISAIADIAANALMLYVILRSDKDHPVQVAVSVAIGFLLGLAVNYLLSAYFVFRTEEQKKKSRTARAVMIYLAVGVIGFGLTEVFTLLGTRLIGGNRLWYLVLTCVVKGLVLIWNYAGRKIFVYSGH